jgi:uncharacterized protein (DUF1810 family)
VSDLQRFVDVQDQSGAYASAVRELRAGRKKGHWIWFVFPQISGLGSSPSSRLYAISNLEEAQEYLRHAVLGPRLLECTGILAAAESSSAEEIMGSAIDAMKLRSSMTLFMRAAAGESVFRTVLERLFEGEPDPATESRL